ncbi:MAG: glycosyltransferase [Desulfurococcales archaeon]|nr:glycosyltransferase [Desulfurococcales archaeon]
MALKIAFISRYPPVHCGVGEYTRMLALAMRTISPSTDIYVIASREATRKKYNDNEASITIIPSFDRGESGYSGVIETLEDVGGVDVIHIQHEYGIFGRNPGVFRAALRAVKEGLASIALVTLHTVYHRTSKDEETLEAQKEASLLHGVIVHSFLQEFELQTQGFNLSKIFKIPHGTLINPYLGHPREKLLERLGLDPADIEGIILATPGFLRPDKGLEVLLSAIALTDRNFTLIVAGEPVGIDVASLPSMRGRVKVLDRYLSGDEILMLAAASDVVVLPYKDRPGKYSVSGILHLSMGSLKPLVGTRVPRLIELYQYAPNLTVPPRSPELLAARIEWVVDNYELASAYSSQLFAYAAETQWPRIARAHLDLYRGLLEERWPLDLFPSLL